MTASAAPEPMTPGIAHHRLLVWLDRSGMPAALLALACLIGMILLAFVLLILVRTPNPEYYRNSVAFSAIVAFFVLFYFRMGRGWQEDLKHILAFDDSLVDVIDDLNPGVLVARLESVVAVLCAVVNIAISPPPVAFDDNRGLWIALLFFYFLQYAIVLYSADLIVRQLLSLSKITDRVRINLWEREFYSVLANPMARFFALYILGLCVITASFLVFTEGEYGAGEMLVTMMPWYVPGLVFMSIYLLPYHRFRNRVHVQKMLELNRVSQALAGNAALMRDSPLHVDVANLRLIDLLTYQDRIRGVREWPFTDRVRGFVLFGILPPLTWVIAALIEIMIESRL